MLDSKKEMFNDAEGHARLSGFALLSTMSISSTASSTLWAHLLRKDKQNEPILATSVPLAPVDKTGTSVRLLLHDTQATLEKFSQRIDKLVKGVEDFHFKAQEKEKEWADEVEQSTKSIIADAGEFRSP